jgi:hypothetical protein
VQRHRRRPGIQQQGIRKGRRTPGVIAQRLDEAAVLGDQCVDQGQFMHALDGNPVLAGQHQTRRIDFVGVFTAGADQGGHDHSDGVAGIGIARLEQRSEHPLDPLPTPAGDQQRRIRHVPNPDRQP